MKELPLRERSTAADLLKGVSIVGVLWIHFGLPLSWVFRFCVPVFICVWAYFFEKSLQRTEPKGNSKKHLVFYKFTQLFIPYLFWTILYMIILHSGEEWVNTPIHTIIGGWFGGYGWAGQYFFIILFQWVFLFPIFRCYVCENNYKAIIIFSVLFNFLAAHFFFGSRIVSGFNDRMFFYWVPYVALGICFARGFPKRNGKLFVFGILAFIALSFEKPLGGYKTDLFPIYFSGMCSIGSILLLLSVGSPGGVGVNIFPQNKLVKVLCEVGKNSFSIFVSHNLIVIFMHKVELASTSFAIRVAFMAVALVFGYLLSWLLPRIGLGWLVGRHKVQA